jgi:polar amino acid transport system substrate-binding protein
MKKKVVFMVIVLLMILGFLGYKYLVNNQSEEKKEVDFSLSKIKEKGKLVVFADVPYGVMEYFDESGNAVGIDVDIAKKIASTLGVQLEFKDHDFDTLFSSVKSGETDLIISSITITEERQKEMLFSTPYFNGGQIIVTKAESNKINSISDITDKKVGVQKDTTGNDLVKKYVPEKSMFSYINPGQMVNALKKGKVDLIVMDYVAAMSIVKQDSSLKIIGEPLTQEFYGIVTKLGNNALMDEINNILREMKRDGSFQQIQNKYLK